MIKYDNDDTKNLIYTIIGGWFGLHKYLRGEVKKGIIYTFTVGLFFFGWFHDIYIAYKNCDSNHKFVIVRNSIIGYFLIFIFVIFSASNNTSDNPHRGYHAQAPSITVTEDESTTTETFATEEITTEQLTTEEITTEQLTTEEITTEQLTTEEITTEEPTTTSEIMVWIQEQEVNIIANQPAAEWCHQAKYQ